MPEAVLSPGATLLIASHNQGKIGEFEVLLTPLGYGVVNAAALGLAEPEETGASFIANAKLKAQAAAKASGYPSLADDSGLVIPALQGAPGIYSARWAGPTRDFYVAMARVETEMRGIDDRSARFVCALALAVPNAETVTFEGMINGTLSFPPRGQFGFGYDPIFIPAGGTETFGEIDPQQKHRISHRARAFAQLLAWLDNP